MKAALAVKSRQSLQRDYQAAMREYLKRGDESCLELAYGLGRRALEEGAGMVQVAAFYQEAVLKFLESARNPGEASFLLRRLGPFLVESLSPFEMTHRGYQDAQTALRHLNETLEAEARRIGHALHDEAGQLLVTVHFALENLGRELPADLQPKVQEVRDRLTEVEQQLRRLSHELRPPMLDDVGLIPALDFMAQGVGQRAAITIVVDGQMLKRLPPLAEIALYRSVQEALTNVAKHARAKHVVIRIEERGQGAGAYVLCSIKDDGIGFDVAAVSAPGRRLGLGLLGMRERIQALGGSLEIRSAPGQGAELVMSLPCPS
jgi:signal transduction histidine kinase